MEKRYDAHLFTFWLSKSLKAKSAGPNQLLLSSIAESNVWEFPIRITRDKLYSECLTIEIRRHWIPDYNLWVTAVS